MNSIFGIAYDKLLHLMAGYIIMLTVSLFFGYIIGVVAVITAAILKEVYDEWKAGAWDRFDIYYTVAGIFPAYAIHKLYCYFTLLTC